MAKNIVQKVVFKNTAPKALYDLYLNSKKHSVATGAPAVMSNKKGGKYSAHNGYISGENICLVKDKLIVQTWRTLEWDKSDPDSTFTIILEPKGKNTELIAIHSNLPDKYADSIDKGWHLHYWEPWKKYLAGKPIDKSPTM
ncbi:MAG: SRPBCC domain-containing protein [Bacteroidota bacterium]